MKATYGKLYSAKFLIFALSGSGADRVILSRPMSIQKTAKTDLAGRLCLGGSFIERGLGRCSYCFAAFWATRATDHRWASGDLA